MAVLENRDRSFRYVIMKDNGKKLNVVIKDLDTKATPEAIETLSKALEKLYDGVHVSTDVLSEETLPID